MAPSRCCDGQFHLNHSVAEPSLRAACTPDGCPPCAWLRDTGSTREMTLAWRPRQSRRRVKGCERVCLPVASGTRQLPPRPRVNDRRAGYRCRCRRRVGHRSRCGPTSCDRHCHDSIQHGVITILWYRAREPAQFAALCVRFHAMILQRRRTRWLARTHPASTGRSQTRPRYPSFDLAALPSPGGARCIPKKGINPDRHHAPATCIVKAHSAYPVDRAALRNEETMGKIHPSTSRALDLLTRTHQRPDLGGLMVSPPLQNSH